MLSKFELTSPITMTTVLRYLLLLCLFFYFGYTYGKHIKRQTAKKTETKKFI